MTHYVTRVELHDEQAGDYTKLHEEMAKRGFTRTIYVNTVNSHMPDGTYFSQHELEPQKVYQEAGAAVTAIGRKAGIVTTKSAGIWAGGLKKV